MTTTTSIPARPLSARVLADIASGIAAAPLWQTVVRHDPSRRQPVRLLATERYEVWVIGWTTGQNVAPHDHGSSAGALVVVAGELTEVIPLRDGAAVERTLEVARLRQLAPGTIHDVVNRSDRPATSLHVYSPPLTSMTYYDPTTLRPVATDLIVPDPPTLSPSAGSYLLHPSNRG